MLDENEAPETVFRALARAEDLVSRLDERVAACSWKAGFIGRIDFSEALAWGWLSGQIVTAEDLLLHDAEMDARAPDQALSAVHAVVRGRRKAAAGGVELFSPQGAAWLVGLRRRPPVAGAVTIPPTWGQPAGEGPGMVKRLIGQLDALRAGETATVEAALLDGLGLLDRTARDAPVLLQAAAALEAWTLVSPLPRQAWVGPVLVGQWLRSRRRVTSHILGLVAGLRARKRGGREPATDDSRTRLTWWLKVIGAAADHGLEELRRLELARQVVEAAIGRRRSHSHLRAVLGLLLEQPLITAPLVAERLAVTPQTARRLIDELGASVIELSGRSRFRAWRL